MTLVVHGHFYQPPRENPWTEEVAREPSAALYHDWNARITAECYRPNAFARIVDEHGSVVRIVNNYEHLSFNVGPTLLSWLEVHAPETYERILAADRAGGGAMAQAFGHAILPLANERDVRTQVRWGLADFEHRFGRPAVGMWLPETAVNDAVLSILAEEAVEFTVLAPSQAGPEHQPVDTSGVYRWVHPRDHTLGLDLVFYDGPLSHAVAFELNRLTSETFVDAVAGREGLVVIASDGETYGHHHTWGDRMLAHAFAVAAPAGGVDFSNLNHAVAKEHGEHHGGRAVVTVVESSWSCIHGIGRWREDCGCHTGGSPGWNQRWRGPLRTALDFLRDRSLEVFERRGAPVLGDPWLARDDYIGVLLGAVTDDEFAATHVRGDRVEAFTLLEAQRHAMAMYTSCGWFFNDLAGIETIQVLRYAARLLDLLVELGEEPGTDEFLDRLAKAESNRPEEGTGRDVWRRHVEPARVDDFRCAAHLALVELLERRPPGERIGAYDVDVREHERADRGAVALCTGRVGLTHRRTRRHSELVYAALHLGGLEVLGGVRPSDAERDQAVLAGLREAFEGGTRVTTLLRMVSDGFGPREFDLRAALPDAGDQIVESAARALADRFAAAYERLFTDHRDTLEALAAAGYPLPAELRAPAELALARRVEAEVRAQGGSLDPADYAGAVATALEAKASGYAIDTPEARATVSRLLLGAVERAAAVPAEQAVSAIEAAKAVLSVASDLGLQLGLDRAQELVYTAVVEGDRDDLRPLAARLGLALPSADG